MLTMTYWTLSLLVTLTLSYCTAQEQTCWSNLSDDDFRRVFCNSSLVFRGTPQTASSSVAMDENGDFMTFASATFQAYQVYRGSPENISAIRVGREWSVHSGCDSAPFPRMYDLLVFATGGPTYYTIGSCHRVFSWDCLPLDQRNSLPLHCSNVNTAAV